MGKSKRKTRKSSIIYIIILILIGSISGYYTYNNYNEIKKEEKNQSSKKEELNNYKDEYKQLEEEKKIKEDKINELSNLDKKITETKEKVFELAVQVEEKIQNKETEYKIAYLTFDDGPYYLTESVVKLLKEKQVKATFFTIGLGKTSCYDNRSYDCTNMYKLEADNGHTVANHTYSHLIFKGLYSSTTEFMNQVKKQEDLIFEKTGVKTNIVRFPGGSRTAGGLKDSIISELRKNGYGWVDWSAQDGDGGDLNSKDEAWRNFKNSINSDIEVVLFHDYSKITYSILSDAIDYLEERNYILLPLFYESSVVNK